jgi:hypothetical protein
MQHTPKLIEIYMGDGRPKCCRTKRGGSTRCIKMGDEHVTFHSNDHFKLINTRNKVISSTTHLWRHRWERMYSSYSFTTSALDRGEWSASRTGRSLPPGKGPPVPIVQEAGWAPEPVWTQKIEENSFCPCRRLNLDRPVVLLVARHCTDWATPAPN